MGGEPWIQTEVLEVRRETPLLVHLKLAPILAGERFHFRAGQCVKILCPSDRESYFALASEPEETEFVEFLVKDQAGSAAHDLCQVKVGERLKVSPPFGKGYPLERLKGKDVLLVGMGSGLSPLRSVLKCILRRREQFGKVTLLYGARTTGDVPYRDEFDFWERKINVELAISQPTDSKWSGFVGRVTGLLAQLSLRPSETVACLCGTKAMQEEVTNLLERAGVSKQNILLNY